MNLGLFDIPPTKYAYSAKLLINSDSEKSSEKCLTFKISFDVTETLRCRSKMLQKVKDEDDTD